MGCSKGVNYLQQGSINKLKTNSTICIDTTPPTNQECAGVLKNLQSVPVEA